MAIGSLTQAYRSSTTPAFAEPHVLAAGVLATVLRSMGDYPQALALNQEAIDWDTAQHAPLALSVDRFLRGRILILMQKYSQAIDEFEEARKLSAALNDTQGVAFADVRIAMPASNSASSSRRARPARTRCSPSSLPGFPTR